VEEKAIKTQVGVSPRSMSLSVFSQFYIMYIQVLVNRVLMRLHIIYLLFLPPEATDKVGKKQSRKESSHKFTHSTQSITFYGTRGLVGWMEACSF